MVRQLPSKPVNFSDLFEEYGCGSIARLPRHQNGGFELHYIEKGHLHWQIEGRAFVVPPGSVFFTFPWEKHGGIGEFEPGHHFHFAVFRQKKMSARNGAKARLASGFLMPEAEQEKIFCQLLATHERSFPASPELAWTIIRLVRELTTPGTLGRRHVIALSQATFCELVESLPAAKPRSQVKSPAERQILKLVEKLRQNCDQPWTLGSMAQACQLKRTQFELLTKKLTGDVPVVLLNRFRVQRAQVLLKNSSKSITEIAFEVGFESSQYFARVFHKLIGLTPTQYRRNPSTLAAYDERFLEALNRLRA